MLECIPKPMRVLASIIAYSVCSGTLLLFNKMALHYVPVPCLVTVVQLLFAVLLIMVMMGGGCVPYDPVEKPKVKAYSIYTVAFVLGVYSNMRALENSNVETVIIFRSCTPLAVALCDWVFLGRELPTKRSTAALLMVGAGAYAYVQTDAQFRLEGLSAYFWATLYFLIICFEMTYGKKITSGLKFNSMWGPTLYTNLMALVPMFLLGWALGDFDKYYTAQWEWNTPAISLLLITSVMGALIGFTGWSCRALISATSFTVVGVINKFLTILLNVMIWDKHASPAGTAALIVCLVGGAFYQQAPMRNISTRPGDSKPREMKDKQSMPGNDADCEKDNQPLICGNTGGTRRPSVGTEKV